MCATLHLATSAIWVRPGLLGIKYPLSKRPVWPMLPILKMQHSRTIPHHWVLLAQHWTKSWRCGISTLLTWNPLKRVPKPRPEKGQATQDRPTSAKIQSPGKEKMCCTHMKLMPLAGTVLDATLCVAGKGSTFLRHCAISLTSPSQSPPTSPEILWLKISRAIPRSCPEIPQTSPEVPRTSPKVTWPPQRYIPLPGDLHTFWRLEKSPSDS